MASLLVSPRMQTTSSLIVMVPKLLLDLGNLCMIRESLLSFKIWQIPCMLIFTNEIIHPHTYEAFYCKMSFGGGGKERNEKDFGKQCLEKYLIHQIILNGNLVL